MFELRPTSPTLIASQAAGAAYAGNRWAIRRTSSTITMSAAALRRTGPNSPTRRKSSRARVLLAQDP